MAKQSIKRIVVQMRASVLWSFLFALGKGTAGIAAGSTALVADALHTLSLTIRPFLYHYTNRRELGGSTRRRGAGRGVDQQLFSPLVSAITLFVGLVAAALSVVAIINGAGLFPILVPKWWGAAVSFCFLGLHASASLFQVKSRNETARLLRTGFGSSIFACIGTTAFALAETLGVTASVGIDATAGLVIAGIMIRSGWRTALGTAPMLAGTEKGRSPVSELFKAAQEVNRIIQIDDVTLHEYGHFVVATATIRVNPRISIAEGQEIAKALQTRLMDQFADLSDVIVHVLPYDKGYLYNGGVYSGIDDYPSMLH